MVKITIVETKKNPKIQIKIVPSNEKGPTKVKPEVKKLPNGTPYITLFDPVLKREVNLPINKPKNWFENKVKEQKAILAEYQPQLDEMEKSGEYAPSSIFYLQNKLDDCSKCVRHCSFVLENYTF